IDSWDLISSVAEPLRPGCAGVRPLASGFFFGWRRLCFFWVANSAAGKRSDIYSGIRTRNPERAGAIGVRLLLGRRFYFGTSLAGLSWFLPKVLPRAVLARALDLQHRGWQSNRNLLFDIAARLRLAELARCWRRLRSAQHQPEDRVRDVPERRSQQAAC